MSDYLHQTCLQRSGCMTILRNPSLVHDPITTTVLGYLALPGCNLESYQYFRLPVALDCTVSENTFFSSLEKFSMYVTHYTVHTICGNHPNGFVAGQRMIFYHKLT